MAVLKPLKIRIENLSSETRVTAPYFPFDPSSESRSLAFGNEIYIDSSDFSTVLYFLIRILVIMIIAD